MQKSSYRPILSIIAAAALAVSVFILYNHLMPKKLVFIGDSLTEWCDWRARFPKYEVLNLGIAGERIEGLLDRRDIIRSSTEGADRIFLMTGINNLLNEEPEIERSYREIVRNLATWNKRSRVVVQSLLPVDSNWVDAGTIRAANRTLQQIARNEHADYLDLYPLFVDNDGNLRSELFQEDGVHLSGKGYEVWVKAVADYLKR